jgi:hypothetical protein
MMRRFVEVEASARALEFLVRLSQYATGQIISVCSGASSHPTDLEP